MQGGYGGSPARAEVCLNNDRKQKVLIVDGNIPVTKFLRLNLETSGYEVSVVHSLEKAEAFAAKQKVDVVALASPETPETRGAVTRLREVLACPVLVYGLNAHSAEEKSGYNADHFTDKFYDPEVFLAAVKTTIAKQPRGNC